MLQFQISLITTLLLTLQSCGRIKLQTHGQYPWHTQHIVGPQYTQPEHKSKTWPVWPWTNTAWPPWKGEWYYLPHRAFSWPSACIKQWSSIFYVLGAFVYRCLSLRMCMRIRKLYNTRYWFREPDSTWSYRGPAGKHVLKGRRPDL